MGIQSRRLVNIAALTLCLAACASVRSAPAAPDIVRTADAEQTRFVEALRPVPGKVPVIAVLALNEGTETTDFLVPYAVLRRAGGANVKAVAPQRGRVTLMPALEVQVPYDLATFDREHPQGADYVIVPAMHRDDDPTVLRWIRAQHDKGAAIIGICSGALVVGRAGLLDGRRFTGHWYDLDELRTRHPTATYVPDQRYLVDRGVATTAGVVASVPVSLSLVEAIYGRERASALADEIGPASWGPQHHSAAFRVDADVMRAALLNAAAFWRHERIGIEVRDGIDDIQLALAADAWSRTYRSHAIAVARERESVRLHSGLVLMPVPAPRAGDNATRVVLRADIKPAQQLSSTLCDIRLRYGVRTQQLVALQLEHRADGRGDPGCPALEPGER